MRLFAAVRLPDDVRASLVAFLDTVTDTVIDTPTDGLTGTPNAGGLRWIAAERWHLTLAFYGSVPDTRVEDLAARLARAASRTRPMDLCLAGGGRFGTTVLWTGIGEETEQLARLADRCAAAGRRAGLTQPPRPFRAHLTLARSRTARTADPVDLRAWADRLATYHGPTWRPTEFSLVESIQGPVPVYSDRATYPLTG